MWGLRAAAGKQVSESWGETLGSFWEELDTAYSTQHTADLKPRSSRTVCTQIQGVIVVIMKHLLSTQKGQGSDLLGSGRIVLI